MRHHSTSGKERPAKTGQAARCRLCLARPGCRRSRQQGALIQGEKIATTSGDCGLLVSNIRILVKCAYPKAAATWGRLIRFLAIGLGSGSLLDPPVKPSNSASRRVRGDSLRVRLRLRLRSRSLLSGVEAWLRPRPRPRSRLGLRWRLRLRDGDLRLRCDRSEARGPRSSSRYRDVPLSSDCPLW
jgi:hypothetical protein